MEGSSVIKPELVIKYKFPQRTFTHDERDVAQYALGVGACATNALDDQELKYVYHEDGQKFIKVLPAFAAIYPGLDTREISGSSFDPHRLLHAQHFTEIYRPLSTSGCIRNRTSGVGLHDKVRAIIRCTCGGDQNMVKSISGRFLHHVYPGETLKTEMWVEGSRVMYLVKVKEHKTVLSGIVGLNRPASSL